MPRAKTWGKRGGGAKTTMIMGGEVGARSVAWKGPNNQHEEETGAQHRTMEEY